MVGALITIEQSRLVDPDSRAGHCVHADVAGDGCAIPADQGARGHDDRHPADGRGRFRHYFGFETSASVLIARIFSLAWLGMIVATAMVASSVIYGLRREVMRVRQLGQYTLDEKIGEGAMGIVYEASHAMLRRPIAIKLLPPNRGGTVDPQRFDADQAGVTLTVDQAPALAGTPLYFSPEAITTPGSGRGPKRSLCARCCWV